MKNLKELELTELIEIKGGSPVTIWRWAKVVYEALGIQNSVNEFVDGWRSVKC